MRKEDVFVILNDWNFWNTDLQTGVSRPVYVKKLLSYLDTNQVITVTGPRRGGKTYVMRQTVKELMVRGVDKRRILMVNFEDQRFINLDVALIDRIISVYKEFMPCEGMPYLFFDEIQEIPGWERWVRAAHELGKAKIVLSGSNARLLSVELGTLLTGRHLDVTVYPLSFRETLSFHSLPDDVHSLVLRQNELNIELRGFMESGGFPEVTLSEHKKDILLAYYDDIVYKDLYRRFKVRKYTDMKNALHYYLSIISSLTTFTSMEKHLSLTASTIKKFTGYFEQVYLIFLLKRFSFKVREQDKNPQKVYAVDTGLANTVGFRFSSNYGRIAENLVFIELKRRIAARPDIELFYWKDQYHHEVDFVIKKGLTDYSLLQVCWEMQSPDTRDREMRSLQKAMKEFRVNTARVITAELEHQEQTEQGIVHFVPLMKWLLEEFVI